jgi:hypothetical protein
MSAQVGNVSSFELNANVLVAHGYTWNVIDAKPYDHYGQKRLSIKATKTKGKKVFTMVIYENGLISGAV